MGNSRLREVMMAAGFRRTDVWFATKLNLRGSTHLTLW